MVGGNVAAQFVPSGDGEYFLVLYARRPLPGTHR